MSTPSDRPRSQANQPTFFEVASDQPPEPKPAPPAWGRRRLRTANRAQIVFRAAPLDAIIPQDHPARIVWAYVEGLDLAPLYDRIEAVERGPGRAPIDPKILMERCGILAKTSELCIKRGARPWQQVSNITRAQFSGIRNCVLWF